MISSLIANMKIKLIIKVLILLALLVPQSSLADPTNLLLILSLRIDPNDNSATIIWSTNYETTGHFDFGLTNALGSWLNDTNLDNYHETTLGGLLANQTYYFKLTATAADGRTVVSDVYNFKTANENDTTPPAVTSVHTSFVTGNTATFVWTTNESSNSCVYYGPALNNLNKSKCNGSRVTIHDLTVFNLTKETFYYYKISSKDKSNNIQYSVIYNFVTNPEDDGIIPNLVIYELSPFNSTYAQDSASVNIKVKANRPVEGNIRYGTRSGHYNKKVYFNRPRSVEQEKNITGLEFNKTYYFKVYLKDVLNKTLTTPEYSFKTLPQNLLTTQGATTLPSSQQILNINNPAQDFDQDGLTNAQEQQYNTDPIKADTDGDGYIDGVEAVHGYNPNGPGRLPTIPVANFAYSQPRLSSPQAEANLADQLQEELTELFNGPIPVTAGGWPTLVNSYIYGGYPAYAIYKAIIWSGKTVHPTISWSAWKNSADYLEYINK